MKGGSSGTAHQHEEKRAWDNQSPQHRESSLPHIDRPKNNATPIIDLDDEMIEGGNGTAIALLDEKIVDDKSHQRRDAPLADGMHGIMEVIDEAREEDFKSLPKSDVDAFPQLM